MSGHRRFSELREQLIAEPGSAEAVAEARVEALEEIRLYELGQAEALSRAEWGAGLRS